MTDELNYDQVAARLTDAGVQTGSRKVRDVMKENAKLCPPIKYGYHTIRFAAANVDKVIAKIKVAAVKAGLADTMPHGKAAKGKARR